MDLTTLAKVALDLGVIPAVALFLVLSMHLQNRRLTKMLEQREQASMDLVRMLVMEISKNKRSAIAESATEAK